jgi:hypothetical protein
MNESDGSDREAYARHIDRDHQRLNDRLKQVRRMVSVASGSHGAALHLQAEVAQQLAQLRQELSAHFSKEEDGGYIEEAACRCPTLTHEVRSIEKEHRALLEQLDYILGEHQAGHSETLLAEFDCFIEAVKEHEGHEDRVIQRGFNVAMDA